MTSAGDTLLPAPLGRDLLILDGGLSNALEERGADLSDELWTARLLRDEPQQVVAVHRAYFEAGADVATTASYQASVPGLVAAGSSVAEAQGLLRASVRLAVEARDQVGALTGRRLLVAASVGPYGAYLADGSEYRGDYGLSAAELRDFHAPRLELLASAGPDVVAVETIPDVREAEVLLALLDDLALPAWVSYSVAGGLTRAGQSLTEAYGVLQGSSSLVAAGVNCSAPPEVGPAVAAAVAATGLPAVVYPNRGESWDSATHTWQGEDLFDTSLADGWFDAGARLLGGCCRVGPADIALLAARLRPV